MGGVSNPSPLSEPSWVGAGNGIGGPRDSLSASVAYTVRSTPTTGTILNGEILKSTRLFQWNVEEKDLITHLVGLSVLGSISIDDGVDARDSDKWREDNFSSKDPEFLRMQLVSDDFSLDMMTVRRESRSHRGWGCASLLFPRYSSAFYILAQPRCIQNTENFWFDKNWFVNYGNLHTTVKAPLTSAMRGPYSSLCYLQRQTSHPANSECYWPSSSFATTWAEVTGYFPIIHNMDLSNWDATGIFPSFFHHTI